MNMNRSVSRAYNHGYAFLIAASIGLATLVGAELLAVDLSGGGGAPPDPKGDGAATLENSHAKRLAELMDDRRLFDRGGRKVYSGKYLEAISLPVGGIAAGPIQINGEARRHIWQIFRNYPAATIPHSFFAVRAKTAGFAPVVRAMQTVSEGPFTAMKSLSFSGEFPFGWFTFEDPALPIQVSMEVFSPCIPLNTKDSSIPCAIFNLTATNTGREPVDVSFLATQQNPIGYRQGAVLRGHAGSTYGGNINQVLRDKDGVMVHLKSTRPNTDPSFGCLALATPVSDAVATAQWDSLESLLGEFIRSGLPGGAALAGPTPAGATVDAALAVPFVLKPGEKRTVAFVLAWHFSNTAFVAEKVHTGNMYANWWPDSLSVARDVIQRLEPLTAQTRLFNETFYQSNLPHWLLDRISSQTAILSSMTCHWAKDGFFYAFEGCNPKSGSCPGNATHVWGYAQTHARLFPEIARRMREQQYVNMKPDGHFPVRFKHGYPAFDGMCHEISASLREHQTNADPMWLAHHWPAIKRAMDYTIQRWDRDEDGMLSGPKHGMDGDQGGTPSWMGSTYLCALGASAVMARLQSDNQAVERYERILGAGRATQDKALFNGEYFIQIPDVTPQEDYLTGCMEDQMLGQWWARQIGLGWLYPREHVKSAMAALFKYNFRAGFKGFKQAPRQFVVDEDAGMLYCTWPRGGRPLPPHILQNVDEAMPPFEYSVAALMIDCGLVREAFTVVHATADRFDGRLRKGLAGYDVRKLPWTAGGAYATWGYSGNPFGDDECGKFYARSLSSWAILLSCQGFTYDGPAETIGFSPMWKPEDHVSFFTTTAGWGTYSQKQTGNALKASVDLAWGELALSRIMVVVPGLAKPVKVRASSQGKQLEVSCTNLEGVCVITISGGIKLRAGQTLSVNIEDEKPESRETGIP
jgi:uncharacterized protein (DUF608 family)